MEKEDSEKIEVYEHVEFKALAVSDLSYNRRYCLEIIPKASPGTISNTKLVLQAQSEENKNQWVKHLTLFSTIASKTLEKQRKLVQQNMIK